MALYRKYRPATFAEVVGQEHVTDPLSTALDTGRISHAYLFSGPRGCGKTSSARILARSLNCVEGPTSTPCGTCPSCVALGPGGPGNLDVIELDAASHGGVDDTRELRDRAFYAPAESRYRVFIVDEAHMVTTAGFNALLKIVEEPPAHLIFIFATTEPDKVLPTIRSRTHHYPFRLLPPATMRGLLGRICEQEHVPVEEAVYPLVIRAGGGSPRDSLSVLDQLLAGAGPEGVTYARAVSLLGVTDVALIDDAVEALAADDGATLFGTVDGVMEAGHDPRRFAVDLLDRFRDLILLRAVPDAIERALVTGPGDVLDRMRDQAARLGSATLTRYAELLHEGLGEMRGATAPRLLLEVVCARMLLPSVSDAESATLQRLERLERGLAGGPVGSAPAVTAPPAATPAAAAGSPSGPPRRRGAEALAAMRENRGNSAADAGGAGPVRTDGPERVVPAAGVSADAQIADRPAPAGSERGTDPSSGAAASAAPRGGGESAGGERRPTPAGDESASDSMASAARAGGGANPSAPVAEPDSIALSGSGPAGESNAVAEMSAPQAGASGATPVTPGQADDAARGGEVAAGQVSSESPAAQGGSDGTARGSAPSARASGAAASGAQTVSPAVDPSGAPDGGADSSAVRGAGPERGGVDRSAARSAEDDPGIAVSGAGPDRGVADPGAARGAGRDQGVADPGAARGAGRDQGVADPSAGRGHGGIDQTGTRSSAAGSDPEAADSAATSSSAVGEGARDRADAQASHSSSPEPAGSSSAPSGDLLREVEAAWADIRAKVREFGAAVQAMLAGASVARVEGEVIVFAHQHAPLAQRLSDPRNLDAVRSAVRAVLGRDHEVRWEAGGAAPRPTAAPRAGGSGNRPRNQAGNQPGRESGNATGRASGAAAPPRFSRPSQARNANAEKPGDAGRSRASGADPRPYPADDDIPPPDYPDLPDDPGPADYARFDAGSSANDAPAERGWDRAGAVPASTPEEEQEMMAAAADPVAPGDRRDPDEVALELLKSELGATRLDG
ncbi:DNA polymerase III subunit gamma and tau [Nocardia niwae]|uniref:DNA polymerase III subunit gamma and tau n=1 Tax=Nocardia niwae TaxID=626084 RepID=UPI000A023DAE